MILNIKHNTLHRYASEASHVSLLLRLRPTMCHQQSELSWSIDVNGIDVKAAGPNAFGDDEAHISLRAVGQELAITVSGMVETRDNNGIINGFCREVRPIIFCRSTALTLIDQSLCDLAMASAGSDTLARMHDLAARVRNGVKYRAGATNSATSARESLKLGLGVCQDHAHIFVAAARSLSIPARYVVGYYMADKAEDALHETHAWAEVYVEHLGWVGFDVTNGVCVTNHYVRLCSGLDAHDAAPIKGAVFGTQEIGIDADVSISEASGEQIQQIQQ